MSEVPWAQVELLAVTHVCCTGRTSSGSGCHEDLENEHRAQDSESLGSHGLLQAGTPGKGGDGWEGESPPSVGKKRMTQGSDEQ